MGLGNTLFMGVERFAYALKINSRFESGAHAEAFI